MGTLEHVREGQGRDYEMYCQESADAGFNFGDKIQVKEPDAEVPGGSAECRLEVLSAYPESQAAGETRGALMIDQMMQRVKEESEEEKKSVCYIVVAHGVFVD